MEKNDVDKKIRDLKDDTDSIYLVGGSRFLRCLDILSDLNERVKNVEKLLKIGEK